MELLEEGLVTQLEVEKLWAGLPKVGNSVDAAGAKGTAKGTLINLQGFLEFDRQVLRGVFFSQKVRRREGEGGVLAVTHS